MSNRSVSLSFSIGDLPMIAQAFSIARATAMMCGNKIAKERLARYLDIIKALVPPEAAIFDAEEFAEICACIATCKEWTIHIVKPDWRARGKIQVKVDERKWQNEYHHSINNGFTTESPEFVSLKAFLEQLAGLDSKQVEREYSGET